MRNKPLLITVILLFLLIFTAIILRPTHKEPATKKALAIKEQGVIAIVIDDWGYHLDNLAILKEISVPLTCAVLPNLKNSGQVAKELKKAGCQIILHLPMQPKGNKSLEKNTITLKMSEQEIENILTQGLSSVIYAQGVSNHMGSAITEDKKIMAEVLTQIKKRKLYFLDSFVTSKSVGRQISALLKVNFAKRDIFLDHQNDPLYIKNQLIRLKSLAKKQKITVAIGHDRKNTLLVLKQILPLMQKEGFRFVFISQITEVPS